MPSPEELEKIQKDNLSKEQIRKDKIREDAYMAGKNIGEKKIVSAPNIEKTKSCLQELKYVKHELGQNKKTASAINIEEVKSCVQELNYAKRELRQEQDNLVFRTKELARRQKQLVEYNNAKWVKDEICRVEEIIDIINKNIKNTS